MARRARALAPEPGAGAPEAPPERASRRGAVAIERDDLAEAREHNDLGRAAAERARINVQHRSRDALERITLQHAELGQELERALKTGLYCSYRP